MPNFHIRENTIRQIRPFWRKISFSTLDLRLDGETLKKNYIS